MPVVAGAFEAAGLLAGGRIDEPHLPVVVNGGEHRAVRGEGHVTQFRRDVAQASRRITGPLHLEQPDAPILGPAGVARAERERFAIGREGPAPSESRRRARQLMLRPRISICADKPKAASLVGDDPATIRQMKNIGCLMIRLGTDESPGIAPAVPDVNLAKDRSGDQAVAGVGKSERRCGAEVPGQDPGVLAGFDVPQADRLVRSRGGEGLAVRGERHRSDPAGMAEQMPENLAAGRLDNRGPAVAATEDDQ